MSSLAQRFADLHKGPHLLILPNAWDAMSARLTEEAGARAIATSSAAVAWAHGYADGHHLPPALLAQTVREIARVVKVPVTADSEGGYSDDPDAAAQNILNLCDAGAQGINIEDGREPHELHVRKVEAIRKATERAGHTLFINARTDVFLKGLVGEDKRVEESLARARRLKEAGADGFFVPMAKRPDDIAALVRGCGLPLNIMGWGGVPDAKALTALGVRRLSAATNIARAAWATVSRVSKDFLETGDSDALTALGASNADYNKLFL